MKRNIQKIDSLFNKSIEAFEEAPPLRVLDALNNHLDKQTAIENSSKRKRWLVAALLLLIAGSSILATYNMVNHTEKKLAGTPQNVSSSTTKKIENITGVNNNKKELQATLKNTDTKNEVIVDSKLSSVQSAINNNIYSLNASTKKELAVASIGFGNNSELLKKVSEANTKNSKANAAANNNIEKGSAAFLNTKDDNKSNVFATENISANNALVNENVFTPRREKGELATSRPLVLAEAGTIPQQPASNIKLSKTALVKYARPSRWAFTLFVSPEISSRTIENDPIYYRAGFIDESKDAISRTETPQVDVTSGLLAEYKLDKHFSIQSGISFSNITIGIKPKTIFARYDADGIVKFRFNCSSGYGFFTPRTMNSPALGDSLKSFESTNNLQYIGIPLSFKYYVQYKKVSFFLHAGITAKFVVDQTIETGYAVGGFKEKRVLKAIKGLKTNYFNGQIGVGADYNLSKHFAVTIAPTINFAISSLNENSPVKSYQHNFGVTSGIKFKL